MGATATLWPRPRLHVGTSHLQNGFLSQQGVFGINTAVAVELEMGKPWFEGLKSGFQRRGFVGVSQEEPLRMQCQRGGGGGLFSLRDVAAGTGQHLSFIRPALYS